MVEIRAQSELALMFIVFGPVIVSGLATHVIIGTHNLVMGSCPCWV